MIELRLSFRRRFSREARPVARKTNTAGSFKDVMTGQTQACEPFPFVDTERTGGAGKKLPRNF